MSNGVRYTLSPLYLPLSELLHLSAQQIISLLPHLRTQDDIKKSLRERNHVS